MNPCSFLLLVSILQYKSNVSVATTGWWQERFQSAWSNLASIANPHSSIQQTKQRPGVESKHRHRSIVVSSEIEIDVPIEVAFDKFTNLPRHPMWSPWLASVEYTSLDQKTSIWTMKYFGLTMRWSAATSLLRRPFLLEWQSTSGVKNCGRAEFQRLSSKRTRVRFTMTFQPPAATALLLGKATRIQRLVEYRMLATTLENFRRDVLVDFSRTLPSSLL